MERSSPSDDLRGLHQARRRRLQPAAGRVVRRDGRRQPQHAQEPGLRRGALARARSSSTSRCSRRRSRRRRRRPRARRACSTASTSRGRGSRAAATIGGLVAARGRGVRSGAPRGVAARAGRDRRRARRACPTPAGARRSSASCGELMLACAGVFAEATAPDFRVAPGGDSRSRRRPSTARRRAVTLAEMRFPCGAGRAASRRTPLAVAKGRGGRGPFEPKRTVRVPADAAADHAVLAGRRRPTARPLPRRRRRADRRAREPGRRWRSSSRFVIAGRRVARPARGRVQVDRSGRRASATARSRSRPPCRCVPTRRC